MKESGDAHLVFGPQPSQKSNAGNAGHQGENQWQPTFDLGNFIFYAGINQALLPVEVDMRAIRGSNPQKKF